MARLKLFLGLLFAAPPLVLTGCAPPMILASAGFQALSSGTAVYINGELEVAYRVPLEDVWVATQAAFEDMQFTVTDARRRTEVKALLFAEELSGRETTVTVVASTPVVTQVTVRVGFVGDQSLSRLIVDRIEAKMSQNEALPPIQPVPVVPVPTAEPVTPPIPVQEPPGQTPPAQ